MALVEMRDGAVHAAANDEVEEQIVAAFVQHTDALLTDLSRDRGIFWGPQLNAADSLLSDASDRVAYRVRAKLAAMHAKFDAYDPNLLQAIRQWAALQVLDPNQAHAECPACGSQGVMAGFRDIMAEDHETDPDGNVLRPILSVWFSAESFECRICGLRLDSPAEITAGGMASTWDEGPAQVDHYSPPYDEDEDYERRREENRRNQE